MAINDIKKDCAIKNDASGKLQNWQIIAIALYGNFVPSSNQPYFLPENLFNNLTETLKSYL